jgi:hypothetical protein
MWFYFAAILVFGVALGTEAPAQTTRDGKRFDPTAELKATRSFDGGATVLRQGARKQIVLSIRNWIVQNRQQILTFPEQGLLVIQVRAGSLTTIIDGKRQERGVDEFWTVPAGTAMGIETGDDSVVLQVVSLREP